jgi:dihydrofolate reductase
VGRYIYSMQVSIDGFVETTDRSLDWALVDEEFHRFVNAQARDNAAYVNGRRMYEVMRAWETIGDRPGVAAYMAETFLVDAPTRAPETEQSHRREVEGGLKP